MLNRRTILRLCLPAIVVVSCSLFSRNLPVAPPTEGNRPMLYSVEDALTMAIQSIVAATQSSPALIPPTEPLAVTPTPMPILMGTPFNLLGEHHVALGESISCIGRAYGVSPKAIADANGIDLVSELQVGQVLRIPASQWTNMSEGPVCLPQFAFPAWPVDATVEARATKKPNDGSNANQPPPSGGPTNPPSGGPTGPTAKPPSCLPPFCGHPTVIIFPPPPTKPPVGITQPPP